MDSQTGDCRKWGMLEMVHEDPVAPKAKNDSGGRQNDSVKGSGGGGPLHMRGTRSPPRAPVKNPLIPMKSH